MNIDYILLIMYFWLKKNPYGFDYVFKTNMECV